MKTVSNPENIYLRAALLPIKRSGSTETQNVNVWKDDMLYLHSIDNVSQL